MLSSGNAKKMYRCRTWEDDEVTVLLVTWKEYHKELKSQKRNAAIYKRMAADLELCGLLKSAKEIQMKVKNLSAIYRKEKAAMCQNGGEPSTWKFFTEVAEILEFSSNNDTVLVEDNVPSNFEITETIEFDEIIYNGVHLVRVDTAACQTDEEVSLIQEPTVIENLEFTEIPLEVNNEKNRKRNIEECLEEMDAKYKKAILRLQETDKEIISLVKETNSLMKEQNILFREQNDLIRELINKK